MGNPTEIGIFDTKAKLSEIIQRVLSGERFYITRRGRRVAELRPIEEEGRPLTRGCLKNDEYWMSDDFDAPLEDFEDSM